MKKNKILLLLITLTTFFSCNVKSVDSIIINAKIYTVNKQNEIVNILIYNEYMEILDKIKTDLDKNKNVNAKLIEFRVTNGVKLRHKNK